MVAIDQNYLSLHVHIWSSFQLSSAAELILAVVKYTQLLEERCLYPLTKDMTHNVAI